MRKLFATVSLSMLLLTGLMGQQYTVSLSSNPAEGGSTSGEGTFDLNTSVTVNALTYPGYRFLNWTEGGSEVSTDASYTFPIASNRNLVANFIQTFSVATSPSPAGGGSASGAGTYDTGTLVTVTASPAANYQFVNWTVGGGEVSTNASYTFTVSGNTTLVANFALITYSVTTSPSPPGSGTTGGGGTYNSGATATVTATPALNYRFVNWTESGGEVSTNPSYTFTVTGNITLVANFEIIIYTISTSSSPVAGGTTSGGGSYNSGSSTTVIASAAAGYRFIDWTEGSNHVSANTNYSFTVTSNRTLIANFIQLFTVGVSADPVSGGSVSGSGTYDNGASVTVSASPAAGYRFVNWTEAGSPVSTSASFTFNISANRTLVANFIQTYTVSATSNPLAGGSTTGSGTYDSGASATLTASPASGYRFVNWTDAGTPVSTNTSFTFSVTSNRALVANFMQTFIVSTSSSPAAGGTTSGGGTYDNGAPVTVTASPASGYRFVNWTEGGISITSNASYTFTATSSRALVANFIQTFTISTASNPAAGGTTSGGGTFDSGASATVTASPVSGYRFVNWTDGGASVSTNSSYTFTVTSNITLTANFVRIYSITTSSSPAAGGTTSGGGSYDNGVSATVSAVPASGYRFVNWTESGSVVSTSASYTFTVSAARTMVANFIQTYTVSATSNPGAGGSTTGSGTYDSGASATVTATPASGYRFVNWTESGTIVTTNSSYTFTVSAARTLVANFLQTFNVSTSSSPAAGGTTSGSGTYDSGAPVTVTAVPASGYRFVNWTESGTSVSSNASYSFTATSSRNLVANFIHTFTISTASNPAAGGTTSGGGTYDSGASVTVTAIPASGYRFASWTDGSTTVSTNAGYTFTVTSNLTLTANFVRIYSITTSSSPAAGGTTTGTGTYDSGASATVTASPASGYRFVNWTESGSVVSVNTSYTFTVSAARTLVANFIQIFTVTTSSSPAAGGTASGSGTYDSGASATVTAVPASGYRFVNWTESGTIVTTNSSYTFTVSSARTLVANFIQIFTVTTSSNPVAGGTTSGGGTFDSGASVTVSAVAASGYRFVNWTDGGATVSTNSGYTFSVTSNRTLTANFVRIYSIGTSSSPAVGGTTSGNGTYDSGSSATVVASPATGYRFANWTESGTVVSTSASYTFTVSAARTLVANFIQIFAVTTSSSPAAGGTTTGNGTFDSGTSITVTAVPASGYRFLNWTESGVSVSATSSFTFNISSNRTLVANFVQIFIVSTSSNPAAGGTTSGGGTFDSGSSATILATPAAGYRFVNWTEGAVVVSTTTSYVFTVSSARTLVANFVQIFTVTVSSSPATGGTVSGGGTYNTGSSVTVIATPATGYRFVNWTEGGVVVSAVSSYTFTLTATRTLVANFVQTFSVSASSNPVAGGSITGSGTYDIGSSITMTATPSAGYRFSNWTDGGIAVSTSSAYTFTLTANRTLVANFIQIFTVTTSPNPAAGGTTSGNGTYDTGSQVTAVATPASGYRFVSWTESGVSVSTIASFTFAATANRTLVANFVQTFQVTAAANPAAGGTISGGGTYDSGSPVSVTATPATGYRFVNWTEGGTVVSTTSVYSFTVTSVRNLVANFILTYTIATSSSPAGGGSTSGGGVYDSGSSITVSGVPASGYRFVNWTEGGTPVSTNVTYTFTASSNRTLVANFIRLYTVTTSSNPATGGTTTGNGTFDSGSPVTVTATPSAGYRFVNWSEGGNSVSTNATYTFSISANRALSANFIRTFTVTTSASPTAGGTTTGSGSYDEGTSVTVTAAPALGYNFSQWKEGANAVSSSQRYTFPISANRNLVAEFKLIPVVFNLTQADGEKIENNDTIRIGKSDAGSLTINVESNFDWTVKENCMWLSVSKESNTSVKVTYMENISVVDKTAPIVITNQLDNELKVNINQKGRISLLNDNKFESTVMYPNPAGDIVNFRLGEGEFRRILVVITSIQGNILSTAEFNDVPGKEVIHVNLASLPTGQYLVRIGDDISGKTFRLIRY